MEKRLEKTKAVKNRYIASGVFVFFAVLLEVLARNVEGFGEWYAVSIYPFFVNTYARLTGVIPFAILELAVIALVLVLLFLLCRGIIMLIKRKRKFWRAAVNGGSILLLTVSIIFMLFVALCGVNYYRDEFSKVSGFVLQSYSVEELEAVCIELAGQINEAELYIERDDNGEVILPDQLKALCVAAMKGLGENYPSLSGYYPKPKYLLFPLVMSYQDTMGMYSPFTLEATINGDVPSYNIPDTMCHELSHMKGFMREDEAGFIAYIACRESGNPVLKYSGAMNAFVYATNKLYSAGGAGRYSEIMDMISEEARHELAINNAYWKQFEGPVKETTTAIYNTYLEANSQKDGRKSYGRMVDLLLAEYLQREGTKE